MKKMYALFLVVLACGYTAKASNEKPPKAPTPIRLSAGKDLWNITAKKNPEVLLDGLISDGNKPDNEYGANNNFAMPFEFYVSLGDSCYTQLRIEGFHGYGKSKWTAILYDSNRVKLKEVTVNGKYNAWTDMPGLESVKQPVRFVKFSIDNPSLDLRELRFYGKAAARCSPVLPINKVIWRADPGIRFQGGSAIGGKDTNYMKLKSGLPLYGSFRSPTNVFIWAHDQQAPFDRQSFEIDKYGDFEKSTLRFHKRLGTPVMLYINGATSKVLGNIKSDDYNTLSQSNNYKDIPPGSDSTSYTAWTKNHGRVWKMMAHLYAGNRSSNLGPSYKVYGQGNPLLTPGQDKIKVFEIGNEDDKTWFGLQAYHSPIVLLQKLKVAYDSIRSVDANAKVFLGALFSADTAIWKAMYFLNYWLYPGKPFPADGFNFNQYISNRYGGQSHYANTHAVSPEQFRVTERIWAMKAFRDRYFPGAGLRWTEVGFATGNSDYNVRSVPGIPDSMVAANFMLRTLERAAAVPNGLDAVYNYFHTSDGSGTFGNMYMVKENFNSKTYSYTGSTRRPMWWWYAARMNAMHEFKGWSTMVKDGDSTGVTVTRYDHRSDRVSKAYYVCMGSYKGAVTRNFQLAVGWTVRQATLVRMAYGKEEGERINLPVRNGMVTIPEVTETPMYVIVTNEGPFL